MNTLNNVQNLMQKFTNLSVGQFSGLLSFAFILSLSSVLYLLNQDYTKRAETKPQENLLEVYNLELATTEQEPRLNFFQEAEKSAIRNIAVGVDISDEFITPEKVIVQSGKLLRFNNQTDKKITLTSDILELTIEPNANTSTTLYDNGIFVFELEDGRSIQVRIVE